LEQLMNVWPLPRLLFKSLSSIQETRPAALITDPDSWAALRSQINLPLVVQAEPSRPSLADIQTLTQTLPSLADVVYVVGDDVLCEVGRHVALTNNKPLVIIPTALSSDAPFVATSTVQDGDRLTELQVGPATEVILDLEVIAASPAHKRATGVVELFSMLTAIMDWNYASQKNQAGEARLVPWAMGLAAQITAQASKIVTPLGMGDMDALRTLADLLCLTVQLDNVLGHRRLSQGTEHIFANASQVRATPAATPAPASHAERVGPGLLLATALYNKDCTNLRTMLETAGVRLGQVAAADLRDTFLALPDYARQHNAPFTLLNELSAGSDALEQALRKSTLLV
jgi:glycerol dehydrogenase-like iron-containing ADH family enzyme